MTLRRFISKSMTYALASAVLLVYLVPMSLVLLNSVKSEQEASVLSFELPETIRFSNYLEVLSSPAVARGAINGFIVTVAVTAITVLICALAAFVIARRPTRASSAVYMYLLSGLIAPFAFLPAIRLLQLLGLYGTYPGLVLINVAVQIPFITLIFVGFIKQLPREIDEAARIDGCSPIGVFFRIVFPLLKPVNFTASILLATFAWNEFRNVLFLMPDSSKWTMPMTVYNYQGLHTYNYALVCANLVITVLPVLAVFLLWQKHIVSGMVSGAVRG